MWRSILFYFCLVFLSHKGIGQDFEPIKLYPLISTDRPRVNISSNRFETIKNNIQNSNDRVINLYDKINKDSWAFNCYLGYNDCSQNNEIYLVNNEQNNWEWSFESEGTAIKVMQMIILYLNISDENDEYLNYNKNDMKCRLNFIAEEFLTYMNDFLNSYSNASYNEYDRFELEKGFRFISEFGPILLDWGFNDIQHSNVGLTNCIYGSESLRTEIANKLWKVHDHFMKYFIYENYFDNNHWNNQYHAGGHALRNNMYNMKMVMSLYHINELSTEKRNKLTENYKLLYDILTDELIPIFRFYLDDNENNQFDENEGNAHWGGTYNYIARLGLTEYFNLISKGTNWNLYEKSPWINSLMNQFFYLYKPDETTLHYGDDVKDFSNSSLDVSVLFLFNNFSHPKNKWMMKKYEDKVHNLGTFTRIEEILLRDFSIPLDLPNEIPALNSFFSKKTGTFIYKSNFNNDGTMFTFINAPSNKNNHEHLDNNSFQLYKYGPLFIDSGSYDSYESEHYLNYYTRTIAHNVITIFNPDEQFSYGYNNENLSNDGGQFFKEQLESMNDIITNYNFEDSWINFINKDDFTYIYSDASSSYSDEKVDSYVRKVFYRKRDSKDRIIIFDYVDQPNTENPFSVNWNAHFKNKPIPNDLLLGHLPIRLENGVKTKNIKKWTINNKKDNQSAYYGIAELKTLLPLNVETRLIGGENHNYTVNGINYPPLNEDKSEKAKWRMEISQPSSANSLVFLNTIEVGDDSNLPENTSELISDFGSSTVIKWDDELYFFNKKNKNTPVHTHLALLNNNSFLLKIYAFDLKPDLLYDIKNVNEILYTVKTDENGFLKTENYLNLSSTTQLVITPHEDNDNSNNLLKLTPNPIKTGNSLIITFKEKKILEKEKKFIKIYDIKGNLLIEDTFIGNKYTINNINFPTGLYIVKIHNNNYTSSSNLLVK